MKIFHTVIDSLVYTLHTPTTDDVYVKAQNGTVPFLRQIGYAILYPCTCYVAGVLYAGKNLAMQFLGAIAKGRLGFFLVVI